MDRPKQQKEEIIRDKTINLAFIVHRQVKDIVLDFQAGLNIHPNTTKPLPNMRPTNIRQGMQLRFHIHDQSPATYIHSSLLHQK